MKKSIVVTFAVLLLMIVLAGVGWAVDPKNTGCGLGSLAFEGQNGLMSQVLAATTNGIFGNQTFAITFGTWNCEKYKTFAYNEKVDTFVAHNMDNLARDIARGQGEYVNTLALLMEIPDAKQAAFRSQLQAHFSDIYNSDQITYPEVVQNIVIVAQAI
jgi:hypothetical protein